MRRQIIVMFCGLFLLPLPAAFAEAPPAAVNRGALFKVQDASHTLYLFGTIHVGAPDFYPLEPTVTRALHEAGALALEIDPTADPRLAASAVLKYGMDAPGGKAPADCRQALAPRVAPLLQKYGIPAEAAAPMKPWMLASVLAISEFSTLGYRADLAVDSYLSQQAKQRRIPVLELESMESQLALFGGMTPDDAGFFHAAVVGDLFRAQHRCLAGRGYFAGRSRLRAAPAVPGPVSILYFTRSFPCVFVPPHCCPP